MSLNLKQARRKSTFSLKQKSEILSSTTPIGRWIHFGYLFEKWHFVYHPRDGSCPTIHRIRDCCIISVTNESSISADSAAAAAAASSLSPINVALTRFYLVALCNELDTHGHGTIPCTRAPCAHRGGGDVKRNPRDRRVAYNQSSSPALLKSHERDYSLD